MVGEIVTLLNLQPMTALGLTTLDAETFWQIMRRVHGRMAKAKESK
jgi:hypothetical protein